MAILIARRATIISADKCSENEIRLLKEWREMDAYVLLGDPGADKSKALWMEANACNGRFITARDFIALDIDPEDTGKTLFIDGLDEMRAGTNDSRAPLDAIRAKLQKMGKPRFRLSCREIDWRAQTDLTALQQVAPNGTVQELHLEPLSHDEQLEILTAHSTQIGDADAFMEKAEQHSLNTLFGNPLLLELTIKVVAAENGHWPESRHDIYTIACRELATEHSDARQDIRRLQAGEIDQLLDDAGLLCAVLLLAGKAFITREIQSHSDTVIALHTLPAALHLLDADAALGSKVFTTENGKSTPLHRSIAEYLAAKAITKRVIKQGLPLERVLALMQGHDGRVVEPLRGLLGWLAVCDTVNRQRLTRLDPMGIVLNGDIAVFSNDDKRVLLDALREEAKRNPSFRKNQWFNRPFAPLAVPNMADALTEALANHNPADSNQVFITCVLDALEAGTPISSLRESLETWVEDSQAWLRNRVDALRAWKKASGFDVTKATDWLEQLRDGRLQDDDESLTDALLSELYPLHIGPEHVLDYWPNSRNHNQRSRISISSFWSYQLIEQSRPDDFAVLADACTRINLQTTHWYHNTDTQRCIGKILTHALKHFGDTVNDARLYSWLSIGLDTYDSTRLNDKDRQRIQQWLEIRPERMKTVLTYGWSVEQPDSKGTRYFWKSGQRLYDACRPRDWYYWFLQQAAETSDIELAEYCFTWAAGTVISQPSEFDVPTMEEVETWVAHNNAKWPQTKDWLEVIWSSNLELNYWQSEDQRNKHQRAAEKQAAEEALKKDIAPYWETIKNGTAPAWLLFNIVGAYYGHFHDIHGETPIERVADLLVSDIATAQTVIAGLVYVLERDDLPTVDNIFKLDAKEKYHYLRPVILLAAELAYEKDTAVIENWSSYLLEILIACCLTSEGTPKPKNLAHNIPDWYQQLVQTQPELIAPLLIRHAHIRLRRKSYPHFTGWWELSNKAEQHKLACLVLPTLLEKFPLRASEDARHVLNQTLLGSLHLLDDGEAATIVRRRLSTSKMATTQQIDWLVAEMPYRTEAILDLVKLVGNNERRITALGMALDKQKSITRVLTHAPAQTLSSLIEILAPVTNPERPTGTYAVTPAHERRDTVTSLINLLANNPSPEATTELLRLSSLPRLELWSTSLQHSIISQQSVAREAYFVHPAPTAVALALANRAPANVADLQALTLAHLREIEAELRGADTNGLRLYWKDKQEAPKDENDCRDILLTDLRRRLQPLGISITPERSAADNKRADLRVEFIAPGQKLLAVPVEIKKEDHKELWLAWHNQLQNLYAIDPVTTGYGIYLVLWFDKKPRSSPESIKPESAAHLQQLLEERIPEADRSHIHVYVLDMSLK